MVVEEFQCVPVARVVRRGDDDAAGCLLHRHSHLRSGGGGEADVDNVEAHTHERSADDILDHLAGDACIASDDYGVGVCDWGLSAFRDAAADECGVGRRKLHDVKGIEPLTGASAYGAADARYGFDE